MARLGGGNFPKGYSQFEAVAYSNGPDGKPETGDDLELGHVDVTWSVEEYSAVFDDDDIEYVGSLDADGLFQPALDGPNPDRDGQRNNVGDVWVVGTWTGADGRGVARAGPPDCHGAAVHEVGAVAGAGVSGSADGGGWWIGTAVRSGRGIGNVNYALH